MTHKLTGDQLLTADPLARVEGEGAMTVRIRGGSVTDVELRIFEPPGSSRRSCADAPTPSRPTSPRASAVSARWPTR